ncbi:MAG: hypothetical protein ACLTEG_03740 [Acutalibacter sp.]
MVTVISVNHGVCFLPFFFCVQFGLNAVGFGTVGFVVQWVLHEPFKELVGGFGGKEGHGASLLSAEIKKAEPVVQIPLWVCNILLWGIEKREPRFSPLPLHWSKNKNVYAFTSVRIPPDGCGFIQKRHAVTGLFGP